MKLSISIHPSDTLQTFLIKGKVDSLLLSVFITHGKSSRLSLLYWFLSWNLVWELPPLSSVAPLFRLSLCSLDFCRASVMAQVGKNLPAMQETQVQSLSWEDLMEKGMGYSSILAWGIPWTEEPGWLQSMGSQRIRHDRASNTHRFLLPKVTFLEYLLK